MFLVIGEMVDVLMFENAVVPHCSSSDPSSQSITLSHFHQ